MDNLRKTLGCLLLFLFAAVTSTYAQVAKQYSGTVTDADSNEPVIGVNVTLKDAQTGTVTDLSGKFSISAPVGSTLLFSYIGYVTKEVKLGTNTSLKITMQEDQNQLSEVVVIGYGVVKKSDIPVLWLLFLPNNLRISGKAGGRYSARTYCRCGSDERKWFTWWYS